MVGKVSTGRKPLWQVLCPSLLIALAVALGSAAALIFLGGLVGSLVALLLPAVWFVLQYLRPVRASRWSLLLPAAAMSLAFIVQALTLSRMEAYGLFALSVAGGLLAGAVWGWRSRIVLRNGHLLALGLGLPIILWQMGSLAMHGFGALRLAMAVELCLTFQGAATGLVVATSVWLLVRHSRALAIHGSAPNGRAGPDGTSFITTTVLLAVMLLAAGPAWAQQRFRSGLYGGSLDADRKAQAVASLRTSEVNYQGSDAMVRVNEDGTAELVGGMQVRITITSERPNWWRGIYQSSYSPAGRGRVGTVLVRQEIVRESQSRDRAGDVQSRQTPASYPQREARLTATTDPNVLLLTVYSGADAVASVPWRLEYRGPLAQAQPQIPISPGSDSTPDTAGATFPSASPEAEADELPITPASERSRGHVIEDLVTILDALDHEHRLDEETMGSAVVTALLLLLSGAGVSLATSLATQMAGGAGTRSTGTSMAGAGSSSEVATSGLRAAPLAPPELPTDAPPVSPSTGPAAREASVEASDEAPPRSPCAEERARMQETSRTARLLNQELQRLQRLLHRMDLAYENARQAGFANGLIDAGLFALGNSLDLQWRAVRTLGLARGAMTPAMRVAAQAIYAEAAERVRAMANGSPQEMSSVVINAGAAGAQQAVQESLARALAERLKKLPAEIVREIGYPAVAPSLRRLIEELAADGAQQVSNIFSLGLSAGSVKEAMNRCEMIRQRMKPIREAISRTESLLEDVMAEHELNARSHYECLSYHKLT